MSMCNYTAITAMIQCVNISTVVCCGSTEAIYSQGQAQRQTRGTRVCVCVCV